MPSPLTNVIATLSIQDQDLQSTTLQNIVNRANASITFPASSSVVYAGYQLAVLGSGTVNVFTSGAVPFLYVRNANTTGNAPLSVGFTANAIAGSVVLNPGGIYLFANQNAGVGALNPFLSAFSYTPVSGNVIVEYLYAF